MRRRQRKTLDCKCANFHSRCTREKILSWVVRICLLVFAALCCSNVAIPETSEDEDVQIDFHGPTPRPGYPDAFRLGYVLLKRMTSPNNHYAVVFPSQLLEESPDFILDTKDSRVIGFVPTEEPYFQGKNHGSLSTSWSPDSSAVLIENGGRWSPTDLRLFEFRNGQIFRQTDVLMPLQRLFAAARSKSEHRHVDETSAANISINELKWTTGKSPRLQIKCEGETNPKEFEESDSWNGELTAVWDVAQRKFVQHNFANVTFRLGRKEE